MGNSSPINWSAVTQTLKSFNYNVLILQKQISYNNNKLCFLCCAVGEGNTRNSITAKFSQNAGSPNNLFPQWTLFLKDKIMENNSQMESSLFWDWELSQLFCISHSKRKRNWYGLFFQDIFRLYRMGVIKNSHINTFLRGTWITLPLTHNWANPREFYKIL